MHVHANERTNERDFDKLHAAILTDVAAIYERDESFVISGARVDQIRHVCILL